MKRKNNDGLEVGAIIGAIIGLIVNGNKQLESRKQNSELKFDLPSFALAGAIGAIIGIASVGLINFFMTIFKSRREILDNADEISYLASVVGSYQPDAIDKEVYLKGQKIKKDLTDRFKNEILGKVTYQGSFKQGTSLSGFSDLDIRIQFKKTSFSTESKMYYAVYDFFKYHFKDENLIDIRQQKVSIGLIYEIDGYEEIIDIVPVLRTDFVKGKNDYNLFKNPNLSQGSRRLKMNPKKQEYFGDDEEDKRQIIKLIKLLREEVKLPIKSFLIKELTLKAFDRNYVPDGLNDKLLMTLNFIRDNIETINVKAPDNPMVSLTKTLSEEERKQIKTKINEVIFDINEDRDFLVEYFPEKN